ncbi:MAG: NCS2 family permease [Bacillota bacterium]|nr:NCS2 family permease [Bacillota bacterium]
MSAFLERFFHLQECGTSVRKEITAALTSFFSIIYIVFVTAAYLSETGMDYTATLISSCLMAAVGCFLCASLNSPFILTPGVGLNAFFAYTLCRAMGYSWQQALSVILLCSLFCFAIMLTPMRERLLSCIPPSMRNAIAAGLGMFIALIGLSNSGLVSISTSGLSLGDFSSPSVLLAAIGLLLTGLIMAWKLQGGMLLAILLTTLIGIPLGVTLIPESLPALSFSLEPVFFKFDFPGLFSIGLLPLITAIVTFSLCLCFDTLGNVLTLSKAGNMLDEKGGVGRNSHVMSFCALGSAFAACMGIPALIPPIECTTGISAGARTGLHSLCVGLLFLLTILLVPLASLIPAAATSPVLIFIGMLMIGNATNIYWRDPEFALPCFLAMIMIPFTNSVADGIGIGFISYVVVNLLVGKGHRVQKITYALASLFVVMYVLAAL